MPAGDYGLNHSDLSVVMALRKVVQYTDEDDAIYMGHVPSGSWIKSITAIVRTAFDSGSNNYIDVGDGSDADEFAADIDVSSAGSVAGTVTTEGCYISTSTPIYATYDGTGTAASAGACMVVVEYVVDP